MLAQPAQPQRLALVDGVALAYRVDGAPAAASMLIYNGLVSTPLHWRPFVAHYRDRYAIVTWDYPGHGASPAPAELASVGIAPFADAGHAVLAASGAPRPSIVCGLSMGVQSTLEHYRRHPGDVRALVLLCGTFGHPLRRLSPSPLLRRAAVSSLRWIGTRGAPSRALWRALLWPTLVATPLARELAYATGGAHRDACPRELLDELFAHVAGMDPAVATAAIASYLDHTADDLLERIAVPTLVVAGSRDELTPPSIAEEMARRIRGATLHVVEGHSHLAQVERPDEVHGVIDRFLADRGLLP
jgi:pimeloyl-ACP methyl ester carboxylesterase